MRQLLIIITFLTYSIASVSAQDLKDIQEMMEGTPPITKEEAIQLECLEIDDAYPIENRQFDSVKIEDYKNSNTYIYDRKPPKPGLLKQFLQWFFSRVQPDTTTFRILNFIIRYAQYLILLVLVLIVILQLMKSDFSTLFFQGGRKKSINYQSFDENIHELNFDDLIQSAIQQKQYRKAVRYSYLKTLKNLSDKELIKWRINKTNHEYVYELRKSKLSKEFSELTRLFDYIWYGDFPINEQTFTQVARNFTQFNQQIQRQ